jgi:hypothetical protein
MRGNAVKNVPFVHRHHAENAAANLDGIGEQRFEHRLKVARRRINNPEDLGDSSLSGESLIKLGSGFGELTLQIGYVLLGIS